MSHVISGPSAPVAVSVSAPEASASPARRHRKPSPVQKATKRAIDALWPNKNKLDEEDPTARNKKIWRWIANYQAENELPERLPSPRTIRLVLKSLRGDSVDIS